MNNEKIKIEKKVESHKPLTQRRKLICAIIFIIGLPLSYPTVFPFGIVCTGFLLFQKSKTIVRAGLLLVALQILVIIFFGFFYGITPIQPYAS